MNLLTRGSVSAVVSLYMTRGCEQGDDIIAQRLLATPVDTLSPMATGNLDLGDSDQYCRYNPVTDYTNQESSRLRLEDHARQERRH